MPTTSNIHWEGEGHLSTRLTFALLLSVECVLVVCALCALRSWDPKNDSYLGPLFVGLWILLIGVILGLSFIMASVGVAFFAGRQRSIPICISDEGVRVGNRKWPWHQIRTIQVELSSHYGQKATISIVFAGGQFLELFAPIPAKDARKLNEICPLLLDQ